MHRSSNRASGFAAAFLLACAAAAIVAPAFAAGAAKMPAPTGRIVYQISGQANGTVTLVWADSGKKFRQEMNMTMPAGATPPGQPAGAGPRKMQAWIIGDGTHIYMSNPMAGKQAIKTKMPAGMTGLASMPGVGAMQNAGKVVGKATLLGKPCQIREVSQGNQTVRFWMWGSIPMKAEGGMGPGGGMVARKVELNIPVPATTFRVPAGYTVTEQPMGGPGGPGGPRPGAPR